MEVEKLSKSPPAVLALFLLILGSVYLFINFFGYTFLTVSGLVLDGCTAALAIFLTVRGVRRGTEKIKAAAVFVDILPIIAILFAVAKWGVLRDGIGFLGYFITSYIILLCSLILFYACVGDGDIESIFAGIYMLLLTPMIIIAALILLVFMLFLFMAANGVFF